MQLIRTGRRIGQAVKNVQRLRQIVNVLARHGFSDFIQRMGLGRFLPNRFGFEAIKEEHTIPERLCRAFEELGPTFVKLGQVLSTRPDLIPDNWLEQFKKLQDSVQPVGFNEIKPIIESELKGSLEHFFPQFDQMPLASASIAQVHSAVLPTGEVVVVKVQRPGIEKLIASDISILEWIAGLLEKYIPETQILNPRVVVQEFFRTLTFELDFLVEANNMIRFAENMKEFPELAIPKVHKTFSSRRILTQEKFVGIPLKNTAALKKAGVDLRAIARAGSRGFFKAMLIDGLFHGDLHGGNLFVLPGDRIGIIDFGIMGRLSERAREQLLGIVLALIREDFENLCYLYTELGPSDTSIDFDGFHREVRSYLGPYLGLNISELNSGRVLIEATRIATRYKIRISAEWMIVFKAILTVEGMGRELDPEYNFLEIGRELVEGLIKSQVSVKKTAQELVWFYKDITSLFRILPRNLKWLIRKLKADNFSLEVHSPQLTQIRKTMEKNSKRSSLTLMTIGFFVASALSLGISSEHQLFGYPVIAVIYFGLGILLFLRWIVFR